MKAILLAGGKGTRLYPYTVALPKPLVPIEDLPIIEIMLRQLKHFGVTSVTVSIGHMGEILTAFLGDGKKFGIPIDYVREETPLGTAGPLRLVADLPDQFLLMNGDILTDLDYAAFWSAHLKSGADVSIAAFEKSIQIDLGVLKCGPDHFLEEYVEKPTEQFEVSMGIYAMKKDVLKHIPKEKYFDFPMLIQSLLKAKRPVKAWPFSGNWLDIGRPSDYEKAQEVFKASRSRFIKEEHVQNRK